ncbi:alpha/beta hydrolase family protein [Paenibacillus sp. MBLB4367]|uniref:alpha/beta hydrolase family protein n=1 Tax=Paenibacillus sp. MBLB4367 TaxID=3384767 RepID=UPI003907EA43
MMHSEKPYSGDSSLPWNLASLSEVPEVYPVPERNDGEVRAILFEGVPCEGRPTRVFAYYAIPESAPESKVPAMVLVHGGGGTAYAEWVRIWTNRGYAAIAIDLEGQLPGEKNSDGKRPRHAWSGPARQEIFADSALPVEEQWMYHAVAAVIRAHSLLRSFDAVDDTRIGITGISWGGIVTSLVAGVDARFAFAIPVYGCGYLFEAANHFGQSFAAMPNGQADTVKRLWDPSAYFHRISMPMLWVNGSEDRHFPVHLFSKSYQASQNGRTGSAMSIQFDLGHSHKAGWQPREIYAFADQIVKDGRKLPVLAEMELEANRAILPFDSEALLQKAELRYAFETGDWFGVAWQNGEARIDLDAQVIRAVVPDGTAAFFFQVTDEDDCVVSSHIYTLPA